MECAAAVVVFENASPAVVDALSRLFRIVKSFGLFLSCAKFSIIRQMAVIAFPVDFIFAFLLLMLVQILIKFEKIRALRARKLFFKIPQDRQIFPQVAMQPVQPTFGR